MATIHDTCFRGNFFRPTDNGGRPPQSDVQKGVDGELCRIKAVRRGEISIPYDRCGGVGSSGRFYGSSALRRTHRPRNDH